MDICWYEEAANIYWIIELKDFSAAGLESGNMNNRVINVLRKSVDSLQMMLSYLHSYPFAAENFSAFFPVPTNQQTICKFLTIVHVNDGQKTSVQLLNNEFRNRFKPYAELFGIKHYGVIEHSAAVLRALPFKVA